MKCYRCDAWPCECRDGITLIHGDCLTALQAIADSTFGGVITDPPFSSGARTDAGKTMRGAMVRGQQWDSSWFSHDNMATHGFLFLMRLLCVELFRVCSAGSAAHLFIDWRMYPNLYGAVESSGWVAKNLVVWDKQHFGMGQTYRNQHELIIYAEKGSVSFGDRGIGNVITAKRADCDLHPTEKPLELISTFITATVVESGSVLDPFCGSGTTLVAAKECGRRATGIEIEERYCEIAANRLRQSVLQFTD